MIVYQDRAFCHAECSNMQCEVKLTLHVQQKAKEAGLAISSYDMKMGCAKWIQPKSWNE